MDGGALSSSEEAYFEEYEHSGKRSFKCLRDCSFKKGQVIKINKAPSKLFFHVE